MITVNIIANGADLSIEQPTIADGSIGGMTACFCTDSLWHGLALTAVFRTPSGDILMPLDNGKCDIPYEATENCGETQVGLFGTDGYRTFTSVFCPMTISPGTPTDGETAENYTPSLYEQFSARFAKVENFTVSAEKGEDAKVAKSENENGINLHFILPKGDKGDTGEKGDKGDTGAQGEKGDKGDTGADGKDGADYVLTDEDKAEIANNVRGKVFYIKDNGKRYDSASGEYLSLSTIFDELVTEEDFVGSRFIIETIYGWLEMTRKSRGSDYIVLYGIGEHNEEYGEIYVSFDASGKFSMHLNREIRDPYTNPCLVEGTPINMADGSEKPIEEVKTGDIVQSYNPVTEEITPAVVIKAYVTGYNRDYTVYNFSNGKHLTIYGLHGFYNKRSGATKDIRKVTRDDRFVDMSGEAIQWAGSRDMLFSGEKKARYNIITSNNLYFANGILLGSRAPNKLQLALDHGIPLSEEIREVWQRDCDDYNAYENFLNDSAFYAEVAEDYQELAKAKNIIRVNKKRLADSDYKAQKYVEGLIDGDDWKQAKDKRARYRKEINDYEAVMKERQAKVDEVIKKHRGDMTPRSIFEACCVRDNALFDKCKEYFAKEREAK